MPSRRELLGYPIAAAARPDEGSNRDVVRVDLAPPATAVSVVAIGLADRVVDPAVEVLRTDGYHRPGDGGAAAYRRVTAEPVHAGKLRSRDGAWWELAETSPDARMFGAVGDGVTDDTSALRALFDYAAGFVRTGLADHIRHPGAAVVVPPGVYLLASLDAPLQVSCDLRSDGAAFLVDESFAGTVLAIGYLEPPFLLAAARISLPDVYKKPNSKIVSGSIGVRVANCNACRISIGRIDYFESNLWLGGVGQGTVYCDLFLGQSSYGRRHVVVRPGKAGWFNRNNVYSGNFRMGGGGDPNAVHLSIDGSKPATAVVGNTFLGLSLEGAGAKRIIDARGAYGNLFIACYHESGLRPQAALVEGPLVVRENHGLVVGDMISFIAEVYPRGMNYTTGYYVTSVVSKDRFTVSNDKNGKTIDFGVENHKISYFWMCGVVFDGSGGLCKDNKFLNCFSPPSTFVNFANERGAFNNGPQGDPDYGVSAYGFDDAPIFRARNLAKTAQLRPAFAAYAPATDPATSPRAWSVALSDAGILFAEEGRDVGRLHVKDGAPRFSSGAETPDRVLVTSLAPIRVAADRSRVVPASRSVVYEFPAEGVRTGDFVVANFSSSVPDGIVLSWARVSKDGYVSLCLSDTSGSDVDAIGITIDILTLKV